MTDAYDIQVDAGHEVTLPSGEVFFVLTESEKKFIESKILRYMSDNHFTNISDLSELDKIVSNELLIHRWSLWALRRQDYYGDDINEKQIADLINDFTTQCRGLKKLLGIDKVTRDRSHGDESVAARWDDLKRRALEFNVFRNDQAAHVVESFQRLKAMLQFFDNADEQEALENHVRMEDVIEVLREEIIAFDKIDEDFKQNKQRYWVRRQ